MLIPLGTDRPRERPTLIVYALIAINIIVFMFQTLFEGLGNEAAIDPLVLAPEFDGFLGSGPWTLITYAFLHGDFLHLFFNMLFLYVMGPNVEDRFGRVGFTLYYLGGGVAAGLAHLVFSDVGVIGASGAVAAVTGSYLVLFPKTRIKTLWIFILIGVYMLPSWWIIAFAIVRDLIPTFAFTRGNIAHEAHLGGYAFGIGVSFLLLWTRLIRREPYELATILRQAKRRRELKEIEYSAKRRPAPMAVDAKGARPPKGVAPALSEAASTLRAEVSTHAAANRLEEAAAGYRALLDRHAHEPAATVLSRRAQLDIANHFFQAGDHALAARAYERFVETYPRDDEASRTKLMLALVWTRYLGRTDDARALLNKVRSRLREDETELADQLLAELGSEEDVA